MGGVGDLASLADELEISKSGLSPQDRSNLARRWLGESTGRWLLVLDNVASASDMRHCCPTLGSGHVLVTSRDQRMKQFGALLTLGPLDRDSAVDYLLRQTRRHHECEGARRLAADLGYLPLALCHAAALCTTMGFETYRGLLRKLPGRELFDSHPELSYAQTVASTWKVSIDAAAARSRLAARVLSMAAHLGPDAIPTSLFEHLVGESHANAKDVNEAIGALADLSLVTVGSDGVSVHRLVQKIVREDAPDRETAAHGALTALSKAFPADVSLPAAWPRCEQLLSHVLAIGGSTASLPGVGAQLLKLLNRMGRYLLKAGERRRAVAVAEQTEQLARRLLPRHRETMMARIQLADAYQWFGRTRQALTCAESVLDACERMLGDKDPATLAARAQLALSYQWEGRVDDASVLERSVMEDRMSTLGPDHPDTLAIAMELAWSLWAAGHRQQAVTMKRRLLSQHLHVHGSTHPATLWSRATLAVSLRAGTDLPEAIELLQTTAAHRERLLGCEHPDTLWTHANLAKAYELAGDEHRAITILERVLPACARVLGIQHHDTVSCSLYLASAYHGVGRIDEAVALNQQVVEDRDSILGPKHPDRIEARTQLARIDRDAGREGADAL